MVPVQPSKEHASIELGPLNFGQPRDVIVPMLLPPGGAPYLTATLRYPVHGGGGIVEVCRVRCT
jgi:hypothetical protein